MVVLGMLGSCLVSEVDRTGLAGPAIVFSEVGGGLSRAIAASHLPKLRIHLAFT